MKKSLALLSGAAFAASVAVAITAFAAVNPPVSIAYPIAGGSNDNYFKVSFTSTCPGGSNKVVWMFDNTVIGEASFYDNFNTQFLHKLPTGWHVLQVRASCGSEAIRFYVN